MPIVIRSLVALGGSGGRFTGDLIGGNGRNGAGQPGQIDTYDFDVPAGQPELSVGVTFANDPGTPVYGELIDPSGNEVTGDTNAQTDANGVRTFTNGLETYVPSPRAGRWRFVVDVQNPVGGSVLSAPYRGQIGFTPPAVRAPTLPNSASTQLPAGKPATFTVTVRNTGVGTENVFLDPRTAGRQSFSLLSLTPDANIALPVPSDVCPPLYLVPTETNSLDAFAQASEPVTFDFGWGDPDLAAVSSGNSAAAHYASRVATPGLWSIAPDPKETVDPNAPAFTPVTLAPGGQARLTITLTPSGRNGTERCAGRSTSMCSPARWTSAASSWHCHTSTRCRSRVDPREERRAPVSARGSGTGVLSPLTRCVRRGAGSRRACPSPRCLGRRHGRWRGTA